MTNRFKELIFTNHALERMKNRNIKKKDAWATWYNPDFSTYAKTKKAWVYKKSFPKFTIELVASKNEKGDWVILSVWSKSKSLKAKDISTVNVSLLKKLKSLLRM